MKLFMLKYNTNTFLIHISENSHVKVNFSKYIFEHPTILIGNSFRKKGCNIINIF